jgi:transcriptional regulator with GAF, ATPase, and Fis domain
LGSPTEIVYDRDRPLLVLRPVMVRAVTGPDAGTCCRLSHTRISVGTAPDSDLHLSDAKVSRRHLEFQVQDRGYLVRDLQSTNGTFYRGARIAEALLGPAAEVRIGSTVLRLERVEEQSEIVAERGQFGRLVGTSRAMQQLFGILAAVAPTDATVLLQGETGTGKEVVAEEIHRLSPRHQHLLGVVDCAALPAGLIESELFGHERGAFTGAVAERVGVFEKCHGGSVFLDEIGELPLELQTRLLRVLEQRTIKRVGSNLPRKVNLRLVAATHRDLAQEVAAGRFRQDLYYRLAVVRVVVPPLRDRGEDIPQLARHFLWQAGCSDPQDVLTEEVLRAFAARSWPGNVRELRNVIERALILADGAEPPDQVLSRGEHPGDGAVEDLRLPAAAAPAPPPGASSAPEELVADFLSLDYKIAKERLMDHFERRYLERLLSRHGQNISRMAKDAGVDRHLIRDLLRKHGLGA